MSFKCLKKLTNFHPVEALFYSSQSYNCKNAKVSSTFDELHRHMKSPQCPVNPISNYYVVGCVDRISNNLKHYTVVIAVAPVIIAVIEVIGVILASALAHEVKQDVERLYY
ncbi:unnamed protein product [Rodentolepis nana]|uniref:Tetraspanin n=1 Tax=Rodentolepis nana TaxID=102285 RepID=A0A0R3T916_RODNA|nr:unnamed protein product [Rodentolepis nana]